MLYTLSLTVSIDQSRKVTTHTMFEILITTKSFSPGIVVLLVVALCFYIWHHVRQRQEDKVSSPTGYLNVKD